MNEKPYLDLRDPKQRSWLWGYFIGSIATFVIFTWQPPLWVGIPLLLVGLIGWAFSARDFWRTRKPKADSAVGQKTVLIEVELEDTATNVADLAFAIRDALPLGVHVKEVSVWFDPDEYRRSR